MPLFQRPYTWNRKEQWEPLWSDVTRVAQRILDGKENSARPHFLGAIVLQQSYGPQENFNGAEYCGEDHGTVHANNNLQFRRDDKTK